MIIGSDTYGHCCGLQLYSFRDAIVHISLAKTRD